MDQTITQAIYRFIQTYVAQYGFPPSLREIATGCYLSPSTVSKYLSVLEAQGRIKRTPGQARCLSLAGPPA